MGTPSVMVAKTGRQEGAQGLALSSQSLFCDIPEESSLILAFHGASSIVFPGTWLCVCVCVCVQHTYM